MNNILDLSSSFDFNNNNVIKGEIEIDDVFELENNIEILVQDKIVEPTREIQTVTADEDYDQLGTVTVNPIPDEYIIPDGTLDVDANGDVDVTMFRMARVGVYTPPILQDKSITITENGTTNITADEGYDGLNSVTVNTNVIEDLTKELTAQSEEIAQQENQLQDIVEFLENKVEGEEGMGMRILKCDTNGYPAELEIYGFEKIPNYYLDNNSQSNPTYRAFFRMTKLIIKEGIKEIGSYAFRNNSSLVGSCETILPDSLEVIGTCAFNKSRMDIKKLPPNLISIGQSAFEYSQVSFKQIPDGVTKIPRATLSQAYNITQLSMRNVSNLDAISNGLCAFGGADNLKAVWIGSKVTNATLTQYAFNISNIRYVPKVFIDLPRATVESFTYYNCGFSTISNQDNEAAKNRIVCNDDKEWLTKEEFDAIDWSTYVEEV